MSLKRWHGEAAGVGGDLSAAANYSPAGLPATGDDVFFPAGASSVVSNLDALASIELGAVYFDEGFLGSVGDGSGSTPVYLGLDCTELHWSARTQTPGYVSLLQAGDTASVKVVITETTPGLEGQFGLYLKNATTAAISPFSMTGGSVGVSYFAEETANVDYVRVLGGSAYFGPGTDLTGEIDVWNGAVVANGYGSAVNVEVETGGIFTTAGSGGTTFTEIRVREGGLFIPNSPDTYSSVILEGGRIDALQTSVERTFANFMNAETHGAIRYDPETLSWGRDTSGHLGPLEMTIARAV